MNCVPLVSPMLFGHNTLGSGRGMYITAIVALCLGLPVSWLISEFQSRRWIRIALGCCAIGMCYLVALGVGKTEHWNANAWYGSASKELVDTTILELEAGQTDKVIQELRTLQSKFQPTYETRARYDELVEEYVTGLGHEPTDGI